MVRFSTFSLLLLCFAARSLSATYEIALIHNTPDQQVASQVLKVIYQKVDMEVSFVRLPGKRALAQSSKGVLDAEAQRIYKNWRTVSHVDPGADLIHSLESHRFWQRPLL